MSTSPRRLGWDSFVPGIWVWLSRATHRRQSIRGKAVILSRAGLVICRVEEIVVCRVVLRRQVAKHLDLLGVRDRDAGEPLYTAREAHKHFAASTGEHTLDAQTGRSGQQHAC